MSHVDENRVHGFIADLKSIEQHTLKAVKNQKESKGAKSDEEAYELLQHIEKALAVQVEKLGKAPKTSKYKLRLNVSGSKDYRKSTP